MFKPKGKTSLVKQLQGILKSHGFVAAAENFDVSMTNNKLLVDAIKSWQTYPKCMNKYPETLSKKLYNEETTQYIRV